MISGESAVGGKNYIMIVSGATVRDSFLNGCFFVSVKDFLHIFGR